MKTKKTYTWRKFFNDIHLWLGIASGLVLFIVCLSGTIYTFRAEIEKLADTEKYRIEKPLKKEALNPDSLVKILEKTSAAKVVAITIPQDKNATWQFTLKKEETEKQLPNGKISKGKENNKKSKAANANPTMSAKGGDEARGGRGTTYFVDPYTGETKGIDGGSTSEFFLTVMKLHRWLLIEGGTGKVIVGISTIIFVILTLTGLILWWPKKINNWKQGFKIKTSGWKRFNHDLHNTLGFYSFILLLIMGITGLCWSFDWYREGLSELLGDEIFKQRKEKPLPSEYPLDMPVTKLSLTDYLAIAEKELSFEGNIRLMLPSDSTGSVVINKNKNGFFALSSYDKIQIDQYSGEILKLEIFSKKPANEQIAGLIRPLHTGEIFGTFSKILYFLSCLIATSLPVTGTIIWINKLNKKSKKKKKEAKSKYPFCHNKATTIAGI